ncbi:MAG: transcription antitermination protein NusB [Pseudomonadota bacterium]|jgi:N utilization substance protein B|nr:transcription antitermination protein NusB [Pseudomonadota bacterium]|tara:strand:- start:775 stop:1194 length:420 start_codon:yes stop_codon:yes gene_type:complete
MKNLSQHKEKVNARELLVQALYEYSFGHNEAKSIEESFRKDFTKTKVDYIFFRNTFNYITENIVQLKETILESAELEVFGIKSIEIMEENILLIIMAENTLDETPREILIDEGVRLSKKFCSENSYKFINATLEKILES